MNFVRGLAGLPVVGDEKKGARLLVIEIDGQIKVEISPAYAEGVLLTAEEARHMSEVLQKAASRLEFPPK